MSLGRRSGMKEKATCKLHFGHDLVKFSSRQVTSGRKIIAILKKSPEKDPEKYSEEDVEHMRRVVAYCKRHLTQDVGRSNTYHYSPFSSLISQLSAFSRAKEQHSQQDPYLSLCSRCNPF
ncbi:hypothetical protein HD806DRAFT_482299 [Xylariaceae sp. AK1471]|nr:hypothetical protein HD806DRAFT_482299 [Xylariaceae sp. AK1471]